MDNISERKEQELLALHQLFDDICKTMDLKQEISKEQKRIADLKKNVKSHNITPPESTADSLHKEMLKRKSMHAKGGCLLPLISLLVSLAAIIRSGYLVFNYTLSNYNIGWIGQAPCGDVPSAIYMTVLFEVPLIIVSIIMTWLSLED